MSGGGGDLKPREVRWSAKGLSVKGRAWEREGEGRVPNG